MYMYTNIFSYTHKPIFVHMHINRHSTYIYIYVMYDHIC